MSGAWLPAYAWWPRSDEFDVSVVFATHHATVEPDAVFEVAVRGYDGASHPLWEHIVGHVEFGDAVFLRIADIGKNVSRPAGGVLEVHVQRLDCAPKGATGIIGAWIEAYGEGGGGYVIPTIPIRGQSKVFRARDDLQVMPGVMCSRDVDTEVVIVNPIDTPTSVQFVLSSPDGLIVDGPTFDVGPWSAWRGRLGDQLVRARRLLADSEGIGSLAIHSTHKVLPYFGLRIAGHPLTALDHAAPIFV
jgi:hypothetical protein